MYLLYLFVRYHPVRTLEMDLTALRNNYAIGAYSSITSTNNTGNTGNTGNTNIIDNPEAIAIIWKSILKASNGGDVSQCATFLQSLPANSCSELLKKSLMLWSKSFKSPQVATDFRALKELAGKAHETVELEAEERDQIILTCAEAILLSNANNDHVHEQVFSLLKLLKASNLDW